jgi:hypothetical protein
MLEPVTFSAIPTSSSKGPLSLMRGDATRNPKRPRQKGGHSESFHPTTGAHGCDGCTLPRCLIGQPTITIELNLRGDRPSPSHEAPHVDRPSGPSSAGPGGDRVDRDSRSVPPLPASSPTPAQVALAPTNPGSQVELRT